MNITSSIKQLLGTPGKPYLWLVAVMLGIATNLVAQDEGDGLVVPADPQVEVDGDNKRFNEEEGANAFGLAGGGLLPGADGPAVGEPEFGVAPTLPFGDDLNVAGLDFDEGAFAEFPDSVKADVQTLVGQLLPLLAVGREKELQGFFDREGQRIATVFDQIGVERNADGLLAVADAGDNDGGGVTTSALSFPNEFADYQAYLDTLKLDPFERDYMLESRNVAEGYRIRVANAQGAQEGIQRALESYQQQLEEINERFAEQFRDKFLESLDNAGPDGGRPDIDR